MLPLKIAARFLSSSKGQTLLIVLGISIGVSVQVFIGSLIQGLQKSLVDTTIGSSSQITVKNEETGYIDDYTLLDIEGADGRITHVSFAVDGPATLIKEDMTSPILLRGFDLSQAEKIYKLEEKMYEGNLPSLVNEIAVGKDLATKLGLSVNDSITLRVIKVENGLPAEYDSSLTISGIYDFRVTAINQSWLITTLSTAQATLQLDNVITSIEMQVTDVFAADEIALNLTEHLNDSDLSITNWKALNADLLSGLQGQSISSLMIQVFVTLSVVLGIASVLAITVLQKSKQLGILKAMGIKDSTASLIFLSEGFILGILGAIGGVSLGLGLAYSFTKFAVDADGNPVVALFIDPNFIVLSAFVAVISASTASLIPARRSSKLSVIEVIKNG